MKFFGIKQKIGEIKGKSKIMAASYVKERFAPAIEHNKENIAMLRDLLNDKVYGKSTSRVRDKVYDAITGDFVKGSTILPGYMPYADSLGLNKDKKLEIQTKIDLLRRHTIEQSISPNDLAFLDEVEKLYDELYKYFTNQYHVDEIIDKEADKISKMTLEQMKEEIRKEEELKKGGEYEKNVG